MGQSEDESGGPDRRRTRDESGGDDGLNRRQLLLFGGVATVGLFALTQGEFGSREADRRDIRTLLHLNAHAIETADLEEHMETLHPEAPIRAATETRVNELVQNHNVTVDLSVETVTLDNETAQARAVRTTRGAADDPDYPDIRERITYELRQHDGEWLVYNRTVTGTEQPPSDSDDR
jgi:hypothetical protein